VTASRPVEAATARQRFAEFERAMVELGETIAQAAEGERRRDDEAHHPTGGPLRQASR
jgi:hypothetical protein